MILVSMVSGQAWAEMPKQQVVEYSRAKVSLCDKTDEIFNCSKRVSGEQRPALPLVVLAHHPRGYVQVQVEGKLVWLDESQVRIHPRKKTLASNCTVAQSGDLRSGVTLGSGERCKSEEKKP
jgi:hypothetical protein